MRDFDASKRTGVQAAVDFLEIHGIDTAALPELTAYDAMIQIARHDLGRSALAVFIRSVLNPKP